MGRRKGSGMVMSDGERQTYMKVFREHLRRAKYRNGDCLDAVSKGHWSLAAELRTDMELHYLKSALVFLHLVKGLGR